VVENKFQVRLRFVPLGFRPPKLQIHRYEKGTSQPTLQTLKRLAIALNASIDKLVFEDGERNPENELLMLFEGVSRLDDSEQNLIKELIESVMLKHDARRYFKQELANKALTKGVTSTQSQLVLSQAVHEDTVRLSIGTVIQQGPRIAERQFL